MFDIGSGQYMTIQGPDYLVADIHLYIEVDLLFSVSEVCRLCFGKFPLHSQWDAKLHKQTKRRIGMHETLCDTYCRACTHLRLILATTDASRL